MKNNFELTYLRSGVQGASSVQLVIILYDLMIGCLTNAVAAMERNNIEERSRELKRGFLVLEQLEGSLNMESGGEAATNLGRFYATLRANLIKAHVEASRALFEKQIQLLFQVRSAWATVDTRNVSTNAIPTSSTDETEMQVSRLAGNLTA